MTLLLRKNFARGILAANINSSATSLTVNSGHTLPTTTGDFVLVIWDINSYPDPANDPNLEIVKANYSGTPNVYNIVRAQEGTSAVPHDAGSRAALHYTAGMSEDDLANHTHDSLYQPLDSDLTSIAALGSVANKMLYTTGAHTWAEATITAAGRAILDDADAVAQRTTLGLGIGDSPQFTDLTLTGELTLNKTITGTYFSGSYSQMQFVLNVPEPFNDLIISLYSGGATGFYFYPSTNNIALGSPTLKWTNLFLSGTAYVDSVEADSIIVNTSTLVANAPGYEGKVGIGTATPIGICSIVGDSSQLRIDVATYPNDITIDLAPRDSNGYYNNSRIIAKSGGVQSGILTFVTRQSGVFKEVARMNHQGYMGIGTDSPTQLLHIEKDTTTVALVRSTGNQSTGRALVQMARLNADCSPYGVGWDFGLNLALSNDDFTIRELFANGTYKYRMTIIKDTGHIAFSEGTTADARLEIETTTTEGHQAVTIDQNDTDQPFIDFQGATSGTTQTSITTIPLGSEYHVGFIKIEINGVERWIHYYGIS